MDIQILREPVGLLKPVNHSVGLRRLNALTRGVTVALWLVCVLSVTTLDWIWIAAALFAAGSQIYFAAPRRFRPVALGTRTEATSQIWIASGVAVVIAYCFTIIARLNPPVIMSLVAATASGLVMAVAEELRIARSSAVTDRRAVIIGEGAEAKRLVRLIDDHPETGIKLVGIIGDPDIASTQGLGGRWLAELHDAMSVIRSEGVDLPIVAAPIGGLPRRLADQILDAGLDIALSPGVDRLASRRLTTTIINHETLPVIRVHRHSRGERAVKRFLDIVIASTVLFASAPLLAVAAVAIKKTSKGPVLFRQIRIGQDGQEFEMYKLRSMVVDAEARLAEVAADNQRSGPLFKAADDPRVTPIGAILRALSIDELPQFVNVLKGDMSVIGPRPALQHEVAQFDGELAARLRVPPGISGLWQVEARANSSFDAYRRLDLHYVENWSLLLDLRLVIATGHLLFLAPLLKRYTLQRWGVAVNTDPTPVEVVEEPAIIDLREPAEVEQRRVALGEARDLSA